MSAHGTGATLPPVDEQVVALDIVTPALGTIHLDIEDSPTVRAGERLLPPHTLAALVQCTLTPPANFNTALEAVPRGTWLSWRGDAGDAAVRPAPSPGGEGVHSHAPASRGWPRGAAEDGEAPQVPLDSIHRLCCGRRVHRTAEG